jgi:hypothetical protein
MGRNAFTHITKQRFDFLDHFRPRTTLIIAAIGSMAG